MAAEKISTEHLVNNLLMSIQCSGGSIKFAKELRALKLRSNVAGHQKLTMICGNQSSKEKLPENSMDHS